MAAIEKIEHDEVKAIMVQLRGIMQETEGMLRTGSAVEKESGSRILKNCMRIIHILKDVEHRMAQEYKITKHVESELTYIQKDVLPKIIAHIGKPEAHKESEIIERVLKELKQLTG